MPSADAPEQDDKVGIPGGEEASGDVPLDSDYDVESPMPAQDIINHTAFLRWCFSRRGKRNNHRRVIEWERLAQTKIKHGSCVFADGKVVKTFKMFK